MGRLSGAAAAARCLARELGGIDADVGYVGVPDESAVSVEAARVTPHSDAVVRLAFQANAPYPLAVTLRSGHPLFIESNHRLRCEHPGLLRVVAADHACATLPLLDEAGSIIGAMNVSYEEPREFTRSDRSAIERVATQCAAVLAAELAEPPVTTDSVNVRVVSHSFASGTIAP